MVEQFERSDTKHFYILQGSLARLYFSIHSVEKNMHFLTEYFSENRYQTQRLCIIMGFSKRENTFDWRIYMKKVPIKELREDLKEELKEELVPDSEILDKQTMGE